MVAALPTKKKSFRISMRSCLLKCSNEQVRKATDAEWLGAELSRTPATELLHSRRRSNVEISRWNPRDNHPRSARLTRDQTFNKFWVLEYRWC